MINDSKNNLSELLSSALEFAIDQPKFYHLKKIEERLANFEEKKSGVEEQIQNAEDSFIDLVSQSEISDDAISEEQIGKIKS